MACSESGQRVEINAEEKLQFFPVDNSMRDPVDPTIGKIKKIVDQLKGNAEFHSEATKPCRLLLC